MTGPVTTGSFPKDLIEKLVKTRFDGRVKTRETVWEKLFQKENSERKYEEAVSRYRTGLVPRKNEGSGMAYDDMSQGVVIRSTHVTYGLGIQFTEEALEDNVSINMVNEGSDALMLSHHTTEETLHASQYNNGFDTNFTQEGGDGLPWFSASHRTKNGTYSNVLTTASLSQAALESAINQIEVIRDETGVHFAEAQAKTLAVPVALQHEARRILNSYLETNSANNDINPVMGAVNMIKWRFLTSDTAWFIKTNIPNGAVHYERVPLAMRNANDDDTYNLKLQTRSRYSFTWIDPRGDFGNAGA